MLDPRLDAMLKMSPNRRLRLLNDRRRRWFGAAAVVLEAQPATLARVLVKLATSEAAALFSAPGVKVRTRLGDMLTAEATAEGLAALAAAPSVVYVEKGRPLVPTEESTASAAAEVKIDIPSGPLSHTGRGVVVGVIDWGCDFTHGDFRDTEGRTRLISIWNQNTEPREGQRAPAGFSVGVEYSRAAIDAALTQADPFAALGFPKPGIGSHGTHVLGIAAGNGRADSRAGVAGLATDADLIFVEPDTTDVAQTGGFGDSLHLVEAVTYVFERARALGRPAVVNLSMGTNSGPHDGTSLVERWIDRLISEPGRTVVLALGNEHDERFIRTHSEGRLCEGETHTLFWRTLPSDFSPNEVEIWYGARDLLAIEIELPNGQRLPAVEPGMQPALLEVPGSPTQVYVASVLHSPLNGDSQIDVVVVPGESQAIEVGVWKLHLTARRVREGAFDAWIERDGLDQRRKISSFIGGSYVRRKTLGSLQSAREAVTVSNYDFFTTTLSASTSVGPTRDGRRAPTVAGPGVDILAANARYREDPAGNGPYRLMTGTSMAAPYVAGLVACMFEKNSRLTAAQVRGLLASNAKPAPGMDDEWRSDWGYGRVDPRDTLAATPAAEQASAAPALAGGGTPIARFASAAAELAGVAETCFPTPLHAEGPFYRPGAPALADIYPPDSTGPVLLFSGTVRDEACTPVPNAVVEVWQADDRGRYDNDDPSHPPGPGSFRCRALLTTDDNGRYRIRSVVPANYHPDPENESWIRVKHVHVKIFADGFEPLTTEVALLPDEFTGRDLLYDPRLAVVMAEREPDSTGQPAFEARFDPVLKRVSKRGYVAALESTFIVRIG